MDDIRNEQLVCFQSNKHPPTEKVSEDEKPEFDDDDGLIRTTNGKNPFIREDGVSTKPKEQFPMRMNWSHRTVSKETNPIEKLLIEPLCDCHSPCKCLEWHNNYDLPFWTRKRSDWFVRRPNQQSSHWMGNDDKDLPPIDNRSKRKEYMLGTFDIPLYMPPVPLEEGDTSIKDPSIHIVHTDEPGQQPTVPATLSTYCMDCIEKEMEQHKKDELAHERKLLKGTESMLLPIEGIDLSDIAFDTASYNLSTDDENNDSYICMHVYNTRSSKTSSTSGSWLFDSGSNVHITNSSEDLLYPEMCQHKVSVGSGETLISRKKGTTVQRDSKGNVLVLHDVLYIPHFTQKIVSMAKLLTDDMDISFNIDRRNKRYAIKVRDYDNIYGATFTKDMESGMFWLKSQPVSYHNFRGLHFLLYITQ